MEYISLAKGGFFAKILGKIISKKINKKLGPGNNIKITNLRIWQRDDNEAIGDSYYVELSVDGILTRETLEKLTKM